MLGLLEHEDADAIIAIAHTAQSATVSKDGTVCHSTMSRMNWM